MSTQVVHGMQSGENEAWAESPDRNNFRTLQGEGQSEAPSSFQLGADLLKAVAEVYPGGYAGIARDVFHGKLDESTVRSWATRHDKLGRMPAWVPYEAGPDALLAAAAHMQMEAHRMLARGSAAPQFDREQLKVVKGLGELADARLTNEPATVLRPLVREVVQAALRIDTTFATCGRCHAEMFADAQQCDTCGGTR